MYMPTIFGDSFFDDFFDFSRPVRKSASGFKVPGTHFNSITTNVMKTDIKETPDTFELMVDLPGYKKEDVTAELKDGYMTITATKDNNSEEKNEDAHFIRRERYFGSCSRSFYVGEQVSEEDIKARFEDGILNISVSKKQPEPVVEEKKLITIEG